MQIDYEKAWLELKHVVMGKRSHGQRDLLAAITKIELDCQVPEGQEMFSDLPGQRRPAVERPRKTPVASHG